MQANWVKQNSCTEIEYKFHWLSSLLPFCHSLPYHSSSLSLSLSLSVFLCRSRQLACAKSTRRLTRSLPLDIRKIMSVIMTIKMSEILGIVFLSVRRCSGNWNFDNFQGQPDPFPRVPVSTATRNHFPWWTTKLLKWNFLPASSAREIKSF